MFQGATKNYLKSVELSACVTVQFSIYSKSTIKFRNEQPLYVVVLILCHRFNYDG